MLLVKTIVVFILNDLVWWGFALVIITRLLLFLLLLLLLLLLFLLEVQKYIIIYDLNLFDKMGSGQVQLRSEDVWGHMTQVQSRP